MGDTVLQTELINVLLSKLVVFYDLYFCLFGVFICQLARIGICGPHARVELRFVGGCGQLCSFVASGFKFWKSLMIVDCLKFLLKLCRLIRVR